MCMFMWGLLWVIKNKGKGKLRSGVVSAKTIVINGTRVVK